MINTLLAIETSARTGSIALLRDGRAVAERSLDPAKRHASALLPGIRTLLAERGLRLADIDCIAFSRGPGSFTGVRVAATVARMLHDHGGMRVVAAPTLAAIAENVADKLAIGGRVAVLLDAKRGQAYCAAFVRDAAGLIELEPPAVRDPGPWLRGLIADGGPVCATGAGLGVHGGACADAGAELEAEVFWSPRAAAIGRLGWQLAAEGRFCEAAEITPLYLRPPECEEVFEQRRAEARAKRGG